MVSKKLLWLGALGVAAAGLALGYGITREDDPQPQVAVTSSAVEESVAEEQCIPTEPRDEKRIAGTVIGAVVGGAVGRDVGDRDVTTAAGAAAGAIVGNQAQKKFQENRSDC